jgi:uncharacterized protein YkwD
MRSHSRVRSILLVALALAVAAPAATPAAAPAKKHAPKAHVVKSKKSTTAKARAKKAADRARRAVRDRAKRKAAAKAKAKAQAKAKAKAQTAAKAPVVPTTCSDADAALAPAGANVDAVSIVTVCLVNRERTTRGLKALALQGQLSDASLGFSALMVREQFFSHVAPDGTDMVDRLSRAGYIRDNLSGWNVGENIGWGTGSYATPAEMVKAWMDSPGHRENILNKEFREIGIGVIVGVPQSGLSGGATYTTDFGTRD